MRGVTIVTNDGYTGELISTRTPHAGSDLPGLPENIYEYEFQPALPMRGVTVVGLQLAMAGEISTRTPHAGSDTLNSRTYVDRFDFNPHSPCGE